MKRYLIFLLVLLLALIPAAAVQAKAATIQVRSADYPVTEGGAYTSMEEVAVYLTEYGCLPPNFITKKEAQALGWDSRSGNLYAVAPGKSIGGDHFGNYEGLLPDAKGRQWTECDIESDGGYRNGLRVLFSNDGLIYYSDDHYTSYQQVVVTLTGAGTNSNKESANASVSVTEDGAYLMRDEVAAYLHQFGHLPANYLTRSEAKSLGWSSKSNNLGSIAPGYAIGGDSFGNREGLLPDANGRTWHECDVNVTDGKRSDERLVWNNDGLIYYTPDQHQTFQQLY